MNEAETRAEHIDLALPAAGWGVVEGSRIRREYAITHGRIEGAGRRGKALTPSAGISHKFVYYQMLTESFQRSVMHSSAQATLPIINKSKWSALAVALPLKLEEQKQIVAKLDLSPPKPNASKVSTLKSRRRWWR